MSFSPTPEQLAVVEAARSTSDNLILTALAGAAKTSTLILIAEALPKTSILSIAFNKAIALEMKERLPSNCTSTTLNSLGHRMWGTTLGKRLTLDTKKGFENLSWLINQLSGDDKRAAYDRFSDLLKFVEQGKSCGFIPDGYSDKAKPLFTTQEFLEIQLDEELSDLEADLIVNATRMSLDQAFAGRIDFNDQLLLPTVFPASFDRYPLVMIDESQDLSALNHAMLKKLAKQRIIAVGDRHQAIYGFRGAHQNSMDQLKKTFNMAEFSLTVTFRCPVSVVEAARFRAPMMQYPDWAKPGEVRKLPTWAADDIPDGAAIICRNNAPLFSTALNLIRASRYPELKGNDIIKGLVKILSKFGPPSLSQDDALEAAARWREKRLKRVKGDAAGPVWDQHACLVTLIEQGPTLSDAIIFAEHLSSASGTVKLMTGHKSKGLEFDHVFFLDEELCRDREQDKNLRYVIITRAKSTLTYINSGTYGVSNADR